MVENIRQDWSISNAILDFDTVNSEKRKAVSATNIEEVSEKLYNRFSSYNKLLSCFSIIAKLNCISKILEFYLWKK